MIVLGLIAQLDGSIRLLSERSRDPAGINIVAKLGIFQLFLKKYTWGEKMTEVERILSKKWNSILYNGFCKLAYKKNI